VLFQFVQTEWAKGIGRGGPTGAKSGLPWRLLWVPVAVYTEAGLRAMPAERPVLEVLGHWTMVKNVPRLTLHAPNWYPWVSVSESATWRALGWVLTVAAVGALILWIVRGPRPSWTEAEWLVTAALLSVLLPPFLMSGMHEQYFFAVDVLSVVYAVALARGWLVVGLMHFASSFACFPFLFSKEPVPELTLPVATASAIEWIIVDLAMARRFVGE